MRAGSLRDRGPTRSPACRCTVHKLRRRERSDRPAGPARGRPAARPDRRAHDARCAGGELLVPAPPGRVRVDRGALRRPGRGGHGLRRGLRHRRAGAPRPHGHRRGRQPRGPRARPAQVHARPASASSATWWRATARSATRWCSSRRSSTWSAPRRCCATSSRCCARAARPTCPPRTCSRWPRRAPTSPTTPGTCASTAPRSSGRSARRCSTASRCTASSTRASSAPTSWRCARAGTACTRALGITKPVLRPLHARDRRPRLRAAHRAARAGARLRGRAAPPGMSERRGALALVLHTHMPYVEGFGTWPFGEEWLWEAVACVYLPLLELLDGAPVTVGLTPVLCDQLEAHARRGRATATCASCARCARRCTRRTRSGLERGGRARAGGRGAPRGGRLRARRRRASSGATATCWARSARSPGWSCGPRRPPMPCCRCWPPTPACGSSWPPGIASHRRRFGGWGGGLLAARVRVRARARARPGRARRAPLLRGPDRPTGPRRARAARAGGARRRGRGRARWTGRRWSSCGTSDDGYPGHGAYRDYHRRTVHDLRPWNNSGGHYDREAALAAGPRATRATSCDRVAERRRAAAAWCAARSTPSCSATGGTRARRGSAAVLEAGAREEGVELVTVAEGVERVPAVERALAPSTWGAGKDLSTWDAPGVAELAFGARRAELRTVAAAATARGRAAGARAARRASCWRSSRATGPS